MMRRLSTTFRSVKHQNPSPTKSSKQQSEPSPSSPSRRSPANLRSKSRSWSVYLILSTNKPIKTYVGVTIDFSRRLKEHNGECKGGAKASRAGRPWVCACIIHGFSSQSEACSFESKWKGLSRKLPRKKEKNEEPTTEQIDDKSLALLQHRKKALGKVTDLLDCSHLEIDWQLKPCSNLVSYHLN